jgi:Putative Ig domain
MATPLIRTFAILVLLLSLAAGAQAASSGPQTRHQLGEAELPDAPIGGSYSFQFESKLGDPEPEYTVPTGQLPKGFTLSPQGLLSGKGEAAGTSTFVIRASNGVDPDVEQELTLQVVGSPQLQLNPAGGITLTAADLTATIDPQNLPGTAWFEYWRAHSGEDPTSTPGIPVPRGLGPHPLSTRIENLQPGTEYEFRLAATNELSGNPIRTARLSLSTTDPGLPPPVAGQSFNLVPVEGTTSTKCADEDAFSKLTSPKQVTLDCEVDTSHGTVSLTASKGSSGETQTAQFWGGRFDLDQKAGDNKAAVMGLAGGLRCEKRKKKPGKHSRVQKRARKGSGGRKLWGSGGGNYKTVGSHGAATVTGTIWLVSDRCDGSTHFKVKQGTVVVRDFVKKKSVILNAGDSYIAKVAGGRLP